MSNIAFVWAAVVIAGVLAYYALQWSRRQRARSTAGRLGGTVATAAAPAGWAPPLSVPSTPGRSVQLTVAGHPAVAWSTGGPGGQHATRLSLLVEFGAGLPVLTMFHHAQVTAALFERTATGIEPIDRAFRSSGELDAWRPVLSQPAVQEALLSFPLNSVFVLGGRLTLESLDGVPLDPRSTQGLAAVATALITALPPSGPGGGTAAVPTGSDDVESLVRGSLSRSGMSAEQQEAMLALVRDTEARRGGR